LKFKLIGYLAFVRDTWIEEAYLGDYSNSSKFDTKMTIILGRLEWNREIVIEWVLNIGGVTSAKVRRSLQIITLRKVLCGHLCVDGWR